MRPEQLTPLDAAYLALDTPRSTGNVCLLLPLDGPVTLGGLRAQIDTRLAHLPILRRRLKTAPLHLDRPWWIDDVDFDLEHHVREREVGREGFEGAVAQLAMARLDRDHPLWEAHLLRRGREYAVLVKVHHAIADGARLRDILHTLFGTPPEPRRMWHPDPAPGTADMVARGAWGLGRWAAGSTWTAARELVTDPVRVTGWLENVGVPTAPSTPFNRALGPHRSWAYDSWDLAASKPVRTRLGVTVNDVVHAATAAGIREWLLQHEALPDRPLVALVPMSVRHLSDDPSGANRIALSLCEIPTHLADPTARLLAARDAMVAAKAAPAVGESALAVVTRLLAPALGPMNSLVTRVHALDVVRLPFNTLVSNVPMGKDLFGVAGRVVTAVYPMPPLSDGLGVNVTIQGYQGKLDVGVSSCTEIVPDIGRLLALMGTAYEQACALA